MRKGEEEASGKDALYWAGDRSGHKPTCSPRASRAQTTAVNRRGWSESDSLSHQRRRQHGPRGRRLQLGDVLRMEAIREMPPPRPTKWAGNDAGRTNAWLESEAMNTFYRYLSQPAPAPSFPGERYLLLTESLLLRRQFSTSPQGSAARSELSCCCCSCC